MRSTRVKLAIALLVIATIGATSAMASDGQFIDVPKEGAGSFAHDPAEWAAANGLTTGCNSPGGGVTASDIILRELRKFREETSKPIVALFMDTAASGGYYVA